VLELLDELLDELLLWFELELLEELLLWFELELLEELLLWFELDLLGAGGAAGAGTGGGGTGANDGVGGGGGGAAVDGPTEAGVAGALSCTGIGFAGARFSSDRAPSPSDATTAAVPIPIV
jgi:hypothetical protein